ncbi:Jerky -like protein-like [Trichinella zimbabwensis]|uniref:Jerky-like protein-like n=1 Tax=Trichinella zimbabwensis TaxID=268475 RepID=A0A0V1I2Q2_9BILA|nr:Jerky -like protein-like [Trichinella zimbabwensis]
MIGVQKLPVVYDYQTEAWMTGDIFSRWYDETFIPHVEEYQQKTKRSGKVLLIIDNAPCHPSSELLDRKNGLFKFERLLLYDCASVGLDFRTYFAKCVNQSIDCDEDFATVTEMFEKFKLSQDEGEQWLADDDTPLFETLTDDEILKAVEKEEKEDVDESGLISPSHSEAYSCAKVFFNWMEQQNEFSATELMVVRHICDIAAQKKLYDTRQQPATERDAFSLMFNENMVAQIHRHTNRGMRILKKREFTFAEIYAALGIIIRASADKDNLSAVDDLYLPNDSRPLYRSAMSYNRF